MTIKADTSETTGAPINANAPIGADARTAGGAQATTGVSTGGGAPTDAGAPVTTGVPTDADAPTDAGAPTAAGAPTIGRSTTAPVRLTHDYDGDLVVFCIGMRIRQWWRPDLWLPVIRAMPPMLRELSQDPDSGLLAFRLIIDPRGPWTVQYWSSLEKLYAYAADPQLAHRPAWAAFNRRARNAPAAVGVWHETFPVAGAESIYVGMPPLGLAEAVGSRPVDRRGNRAADRQAGRDRSPGRG